MLVLKCNGEEIRMVQPEHSLMVGKLVKYQWRGGKEYYQRRVGGGDIESLGYDWLSVEVDWQGIVVRVEIRKVLQGFIELAEREMLDGIRAWGMIEGVKVELKSWEGSEVVE